jgi:hypothetical protein
MTMKYTNIFNPKAFIKTFPNWHFGLKMYHLATLLDFGAIFSLLLPPAEKNDFFPRNIFSLSLCSERLKSGKIGRTEKSRR